MKKGPLLALIGLLATPIFCRSEELYREAMRPQFHFTARKNWHNDPNGLVYYKNQYHLFFQHNPLGRDWGNMTWGHAVSEDLVHWQQLEHAIYPDKFGTIFSGSAVVDRPNSSGLGGEEEAPMVCIFTYAGAYGEPKRPFTQALAWSTDGLTFKKYGNNPVLENLAEGNRDPKVFWYETTGQWVMVLYVERGAMHIFNSADLKSWKLASICKFPDAHECPELFQLAVDGDPENRKWVLWEAGGRYMLGGFDGKTFSPESGVLPSEWGGNCYAGQTWNSEPEGRRIFIGWMRGGEYPDMPFNQQMSFPRLFKLRTTTEGPRLHQAPVGEIEKLYTDKKLLMTNSILQPGDDPLTECKGELWDLELNISAVGIRGKSASVFMVTL